MDFTVALLGLAGAIALFLWGTHMAQTGVQRALGPRLRQILGQTLSNRTKAFFAGIGLTLLLQSSTATCLMFRRTQNAMVHDLGRALIGLGLMLLALHQMLGILTGVESAVEFRTAMSIVAAVPALGFILAAIAAWGVHSSVAVVLLIISLASRGALPLDVAFISVLGANLGTAINPLLAAGAATPEARRLT